jgi:hypothetical protein
MGERIQMRRVASLPDFNALVSELEALDPVACAVQSGSRSRDGSMSQQLGPPNVVQFATKLDALLTLLDVTADALAVTWDRHADLLAPENIPPTIQLSVLQS